MEPSSTPASLHAFLSLTPTLSPQAPISAFASPTHGSLKLLEHYPCAARQAALDFCSSLCHAAMYASRGGGGAQQAEAEQLVTLWRQALGRLATSRPSSWAPLLATWALGLLGDISSQFVSQICKSPQSSSLGIHETLPLWLECHTTRSLIDLTAQCLNSLLDIAHDSHENDEGDDGTVYVSSSSSSSSSSDRYTESCISVLLDTSVRHSPHFDWVVAHLGGCFPETIITRVLAVGLKDFCQHAEMQIKKEGTFNLSRVPKINSVVSILDHLASTHHREITHALKHMVDDSLVPPKAASAQQVATVPYLLYLSSLSEMLIATLSDGLYERVSADMCENVAALVPQWSERYFPESDSLSGLCVHLVVSCENNGADVLRLLFEFGADKSEAGVSRDVRNGARLLFDLVLAELLGMVHQAPRRHYVDDIALLKSVGSDANYDYFVQTYLFSQDLFQRRCILNLLTYLSLHKGRAVAVATCKHLLAQASADEHLGLLLEFVRDVELWQPGVVETAVSQCLRAKPGAGAGVTAAPVASALPFLKNLGKVLQYQSFPPEDQKIRLVSQFSEPVSKHHMTLLPKLGQKELIPHVLKILHFVPLKVAGCGVTLLHRAAHNIVHTVFRLLEDPGGLRDEESEGQLHLSHCVKILIEISTHPSGLPMVLRYLLEGALNSPLAEMFGGRFVPQKKKRSESKSAGKKRTNLLDENLKFGSMPTHPLGSSTSFHAGVIGQGKLSMPEKCRFSPKTVDFNQFTFVTLLFKICHHSGERDKSKEACKQLALLLVELVSPDVMYNGLPWPEEEFIKVTIERDLKITKKVEAHPLLWPILIGLAEARPALCYCSVLLRALMAVQMNVWQSSVADRAAQRPAALAVTKKVLELMSVGQFLPHPLNSVSDVLHVMHSFHVHCVLVDVWNFMRDNVPSPVAFASNGQGALNREFDSYKNYKQYCERLRLIMAHHADEVPVEFKRFFVDVANKQEQALKLAMEY